MSKCFFKFILIFVVQFIKHDQINYRCLHIDAFMTKQASIRSRGHKLVFGRCCCQNDDK